MFIKGFRFGLLLQLAVGPICLLVFNTAGQQGGLVAASLAALAATLVDGLYILLAGLGLTVFLRQEKARKAVQLVGAAVLVIFGLDIAMEALGRPFLPGLDILPETKGTGIFFKAAVLTAANPLTIVFWGGVLSGAVASANIDPKQLWLFGLGCISATFSFLNAVGLLGVLAGSFLSQAFLKILGVGVGLVIIYFGLRMLRASARPGDDCPR